MEVIRDYEWGLRIMKKSVYGFCYVQCTLYTYKRNVLTSVHTYKRIWYSTQYTLHTTHTSPYNYCTHLHTCTLQYCIHITGTLYKLKLYLLITYNAAHHQSNYLLAFCRSVAYHALLIGAWRGLFSRLVELARYS